MSDAHRTLALVALGLGGVLCGAAPARAQETQQGPRTVRVEAWVTAVSGRSAYLDHGRDAGLAVGDVVLLVTSLDGDRRAVVRSVARSSARIELSDEDVLDVGDRVEVLVPAERLAPAEPAVGGPKAPVVVPEHPPWETDLEGVDQELPLLAPVTSVSPDERPRDLHGRAWLDYGLDEDNLGAGSTHSSLRAGVDLALENAFGAGGTFELDGELRRRSSDDADGEETDSSGRIDRLSWRVGGDRERATSWQVGRFLSRGMPEFGVLDGVEWTHRTSGHTTFGAHLGGFPEPDDDLTDGGDVTVGLFANWVSDDDGTLQLDAGLQKTWHEGQADRDLLVLASHWRPHPRAFLHATAWVDLYTGGEVVKSSGAELTRFIAGGTWTTEAGHGWGATLSRFRYPELLRDEYPEVTAAELLDDEVTRLGVNAWRKLGDGLRLSGRADRWKDQDDSGGSLEATLTARDRLYDDGEVGLTLFHRDWAWMSGPGARLFATKSLASSWLRLSYETSQVDHEDVFGGAASVSRDVLRLSWDRPIGELWDLSLDLEARGGDDQDTSSVGFYLQRRFR